MRLVFNFLLLVLFIFYLGSCNSNNEKKPVSPKVTKNSDAEQNRNRDSKPLHSNTSLNKLGMDTTYSIPQGLDLGTVAPLFIGKDQNGNTINLEKELNRGPVVLVFYRGFWCGLCNRYLEQFADSLNMVKEKGASVIAVAPEAAAYARKTIENTGFDVPVLIDKNHKVMDQYGVTFKVNEDYQAYIRTNKNLELATVNEDTEVFLPVPATYIIRSDGKISYTFFEPKYSQRAYVKDILSHL